MRILLASLVMLLTVPLLSQKNSVSFVTVINHVNIIDVTGSPIQSDMTVVIKENRIIALGKANTVKTPANAFVLEASGKYLIPGLWDMHVHVFNNVSKAAPDTLDFSMYIANGVTGIREMWTQMDAMPMVNYWRSQINNGAAIIPRIGAVGTMIDGSSSQWRNSDTTTTEAGARQFVRQVKAAGIDFVKVYNRLSRNVYFAIADECKKQQVDFAGHIPNRILLREATEAGQKSIEHLTGIRINFEDDCSVLLADLNKELPDSIAKGSPSVPIMEQVAELCDSHKAFALYQQMARMKVWHCPTMTLYKRYATDTGKIFADPRLRYISESTRSQWKKQTGSRMGGGDSAFIKRAFAHLSLMKMAGIQFLAGTDVDNDYLYPGFSLHDELELFVKAGFSPLEALQTATINPAKFLGISDSLGTIQKGKIADMLLLDANPLEDIRNTQLIHALFVNGRYLPKQVLQAMLVKVEEVVNKH